MVRRFVVALVASLAALPALAQSPDWSQAGGGLVFATSKAGELRAPSTAAAPPASPSAQPYDALVNQAAKAAGLDPKLIHALVTVESGYRADARSTTRRGEQAGGLTQLMPATAVELGVADRFDPAQNLLGGARYLSAQLQRFGDIRLALAAYNAGPERVAGLGRIPSIPETETYVVRVVDCYLALAAGRSIRSSADCRPSEAAP